MYNNTRPIIVLHVWREFQNVSLTYFDKEEHGKEKIEEANLFGRQREPTTINVSFSKPFVGIT